MLAESKKKEVQEFAAIFSRLSEIDRIIMRANAMALLSRQELANNANKQQEEQPRQMSIMEYGG